MPKIQEYNLRSEPVGPSIMPKAQASEFDSGLGTQHLGRGIEKAGEALQRRMEQDEVSDTNAKMAQIHADLTNQWSQSLQKADPSDKELVPNFLKQVDDTIGAVGDSIGTHAGQLHFQEFQAKLKSHFLETAMAGQAELAGEKAKQDYIKANNAYSSSLINDPSSFDMVRDLNKQTIDGLVKTQGLPEKKALELQTASETSLAKAAVQGWIKVDPEGAKKQLDSGQWDTYIDGDVKHQLFGQADQAIRARHAEDERLRMQEERIKKEQQKATQDDFLQRINDDKLTSKDILESNLEPFGSGSKEQFIQILNRAKDEKIKTDPATFIDAFNRIHLPDGDPHKIVDENDINKLLIDGKMKFEDVVKLRGELQGKRTEAGNIEAELKKGFLDIARARLSKSNPVIGFKDVEGEIQYQKFLSDFLPAYAEARKSGKTVYDLLDPSSKLYMGNRISQFAKSNEQIIQGLIKYGKSGGDQSPPAPAPAQGGSAPAPTPPPAKPTKPPRNPGESAAAYLKRIGG